MQVGPPPVRRHARRAKSAPQGVTRQGVQTHGAEIAVAAAETRLHHEVEADLIERLPTDAVVESEQGDGGLILLAAERCIEQAFVDLRSHSPANLWREPTPQPNGDIEPMPLHKRRFACEKRWQTVHIQERVGPGSALRRFPLPMAASWMQ
jgi:hypothetical protein